jgi:hypothetical protein
VLLVGTPGAAFSITIPSGCNLRGLAFSAQAASADGVVLAVTNALDCIVGTY